MGKIALEGMEFYACHGYYEEERVIGNKYSVDVTLDLDFSEAVSNDKLAGTVNYEIVYKIVRNVMNINANLLEHLAGKIVKALKENLSEVIKVRVKISKYHPPIKGLCHKATVELEG